MSNIKAWGPMQPGSSDIGEVCCACKKPFKEGDWTTLVPVGPGDDMEEQDQFKEGRSYNAVCVLVHYTCATGIRIVGSQDDSDEAD